MKACPRCGAQNTPETVFCIDCNYFLDWSDGSTAPTDAAPPSAIAPLPRTDTESPGAGTSAPPTPTTGSAAGAVGATSPRTKSAIPEQPTLASVIDGLDRGRALAANRGRVDLTKALDAARAQLDERTVSVAVVGEFKHGKSTLVNALLQTRVCPVDADEITVVPTLVRYGDTPSALAYLQTSNSDGQPVTEPVPISDIAEYIAETGNPGNRRGLRSVEIRLPRRMLRSGLCLIDTPGVGGLDSAHGIITLGALDHADALLFVTEASQELTQPELDFLHKAMARCPIAACVITKTDLHADWERIVEIDRRHLLRSGLDIPVLPVSSFLRLASRHDPSLATESGYAELMQFLAANVMRAATTAVTASAARTVQFVTAQIDQQVEAERAVLTRPGAAPAVLAELATAKERAARLASPTASWQQLLSDGAQDLVADVEHDLQGRLRTILHDVEKVIDDGDPKDTWTDIEAWLRRNVVAAAVANYDLLADRTRQLAADVANRFNLDTRTPLEFTAIAPPAGLSAVNLASVETLSAPGGRFGTMLMATRTAMFVPMVLFGVAGGLLGAGIAIPVSVALGAGIGQKLIRDERKRQISFRRQQAKAAARRYVEEVGFIMNKESRDALRRTQRLLRDEFQLRAMSMHRSSTAALESARKAQRLPEQARQQQITKLTSEARELHVTTDRMAKLAAAATGDTT